MFLEVSFVHKLFTTLNCFYTLFSVITGSQCLATEHFLLRDAMHKRGHSRLGL